MNSNKYYKEASELSLDHEDADSRINSEHLLREIERTERKNLKYGPNGQLLHMCSSISSYIEYGPAYPQFFWFVRYNIILLLFCDAVFAVILIMTGNFQKIFEGSNGFASMSHETKLLLVLSWAVMGVLFGLFGIFTAIFSRNLAKSAKLFPADFSIEMWGLPENICEDELKQMILKTCSGVSILKIILIKVSQRTYENALESFTGVALIIFETQNDRDLALRSFRADYGVLWQLFFSQVKIGDRTPLVVVPNDIDDMIPENYSYRQVEIFCQRMKAYFLIILGIIGCFACQYLLRFVLGDNSPGILTTITILVLNLILLEIAKRALSLIKFCSYTLLQAEIAWATAALHFVNIVFIPLIVQFSYFKTTGSSINAGLIREIELNSLLQTTIPFIISLINPVFLIRSKIRSWKRAKAQAGTLTQEEIQKFFLYDNFELSTRYGRVMAILMFTCFIGLFLPLSFVCATIGLIIGDFAIRMQFIKQTRRPERRGSEGLARKINFIFFLYPLLMSVGVRIFAERFVYDQSEVELFSIDWYFLIAGLIILIFGVFVGERIFRVILWKPHQEVTYQEACLKYPENFKTDYEKLFL